MKDKYHGLLKKLTPFIMARPNVLENTHHSGLGTKEIKIFDPLDNKNGEFFERILTLDQLAFGGEAMAMPRWVLFDCALYPGAIIGFGIDADKLSAADNTLLKAQGSTFIPLSMYITIPNAYDNSWFGHNLSSLNGKLSLDLSGLGLLTKYFALNTLKIKKLVGATQWSSPAVFLHLKLSPLKIVSPHLVMHTMNDSFCYESTSFYASEQVFGHKHFQLDYNKEIKHDELDKIKELFISHHIYVVGKDEKSIKLLLEQKTSR
ncbi:MAG: hypothetical protein CME62_03310 [Halobacteriovoraceae bacterium]|nr:hypothetical protein [Halobacteriovoraceae bacterium]|tara:strand:+ start:12793 stop:13578 length:786 start_codon:yes stop_codon:yes gene_type:complete